MSSVYGPEGSKDPSDTDGHLTLRDTVECQLFESLVHHLIEKGILTANDALSVVQTVAEVKRGEQEEDRAPDAVAEIALGVLRRLYSTFELIPGRASTPRLLNGTNIIRLRPPLHGDRPEFPRDN